MAMTWREAIQVLEKYGPENTYVPQMLLVNRDELRELIKAAKRMRELQRGELPYDHQALSEAEAAFDAALQPF